MFFVFRFLVAILNFMFIQMGSGYRKKKAVTSCNTYLSLRNARGQKIWRRKGKKSYAFFRWFFQKATTSQYRSPR